MKLPEQFVIQMKRLLNEEFPEFENALHKESPVSIRLNPNKNTNDFNLNKSDQIPWCTTGYYLKERPSFTLDPFFHAGHYYVQEPASMFLEYILNALKIPKNCNVLDLCSAPGGKSTLLLSYFSEDAFIHSHEYDPHRAKVLKQNLERWGTNNTYVSQGSLEQLSNSSMRYKIILVDAPCSGEGMFRKEPEALKQWSPQKVKACTVMQQNILKVADALCETGGYIIYSTCTYNSEENEQQLTPYVLGGRFKSIQLPNYFAQEYLEKQVFVYRFYPHKLSSEGLTISVIQKQEELISLNFKLKSASIKFNKEFNPADWINNSTAYQIISVRELFYAVHQNHLEQFAYLNSFLRFSGGAIPVCQMKGIAVYPEHGLALSIHLNEQIHKYDLDLKEALNFLRATYAPLQKEIKAKWLLAVYKSAHLGWFKVNQNGLKNYFPINQRIRNY